MIPLQVETWLETYGYGQLVSTRKVTGGCINNGVQIHTQSGQTFFLKTNMSARPDMFTREAEGLAALQLEGGPRVPQPLLSGAEFLLLEDLTPAPRRADYWDVFGRQLAVLHDQTAACFGFPQDNFIGSTPQPNRWMDDGYRFFAEQRLMFQAGLAYQNGLLDAGLVRRIEKLAQRLPDLVPEQPPSLIHGDLWGGNAISDSLGMPAIIDPATHYGWAEAELAMTALFGAFPRAFYLAYEEACPVEKGYWKRAPLYNLYHLLNHLILFGGSYLGEVLAILRRYE